MDDTYEKLAEFLEEIKLFTKELFVFINKKLKVSFFHFESGKSKFVVSLYKQRGRMSRRLIHTGMAGLTAVGMMIAPIVANEFPGTSVDPWSVGTTSQVLSASTEDPATETLVSDKVRDKNIEYTVQEGDTVASIAEKFGVSEDTIRWENDIVKDKIKVGETLSILPVTGISHKVQKGDTVYSIAKKFDSSPQAIVDFPFNSFTNDETFELAIGQTVIVPDGIKPEEKATAPRIRQLTPNAGTVVASGQFIWPASGNLSQYYSWYHQGIDIANRASPSVLAADSGRVIVSGWLDNYGYGNRVMIDHQNGYTTLYAHLSKIYVVPGQTVRRGDSIGQMGSTGRSTGIHLHFEVIRGGTHLNPLSILK